MREHAAERVEVEEARAPGGGARRWGMYGGRGCVRVGERKAAPSLQQGKRAARAGKAH